MSLADYASETTELMFHSLREILCHEEVADRRYTKGVLFLSKLVFCGSEWRCFPVYFVVYRRTPLEVAGAFSMGFSHIKIMLMSRITLLDEIKTFLSGYIILLVEV